ncbi:MAG: homoserine kinase [Rickettsiales bacterium]|nr:homoserine kinase [Pseudomonadota bacterium]MDA0966001.1 homoserine kinase [Pseudomonadota bacterium]MDG4542528.1 homoserine kinase [Rickettsiales bacterium]MDG4545032.1 homoserine kinase [Rickettsiales bacterium]MDG4547155.1 homoserine kinase [Rickettsiales bacterium]
MAVYTIVSDEQLDELIADYDIGKAVNLQAIEQGIENSNYFLTTDKSKYVLTIYEKRVKTEDLPFYLNLMEHLSKKGVPCPIPIKNKNGTNLSKVNDRSCAIVSFLKGKNTKNIRNEHLCELGANLAKMHIAASDFDMELKNNFSLNAWGSLFNSVKDNVDSLRKGLRAEIEDELGKYTVNWPKSLYSGVVHADLFPDNVFFQDGKLVGIIDYYFACNDYLMYDLAICLNAWCFENNNEFNITKAKKFLNSYNGVRKISEEELNALPILAGGAALRFLLTRLYDWFNPVEGALVKPKDPMEYLQKLRFHNGIKSHSEYGL